jgi:hypothetical protein
LITDSDEVWATDTLKNAQEPDDGVWMPITRLTLERYNLIFSQQHSRGYASTGQVQHDAGTCLENGRAILCKVALVSGDLKFTKWSVAGGLERDDVVIVANANASDSATPSMELTAGASATIRVFYVDEDDDYIHYVETSDGAATWGAEQNVGGQSNLKAIASTSTTRVHLVSYTSGNSRFHYYDYNGSWSQTNSLIYWPHLIEHIDAITIGDRDLIVFYSQGPMYGSYREAGIYGIWVENGRWSDAFKIDVLDEADAYAYRQHPRLTTANSIYFLVGYASEGNDEYSHATRFMKTSKDGQYWSQYQPLVTCPESGPAMLLVINAAAGMSWPWDTGQQVYLVGYDKVYESDATRAVGEENATLQVDVSSRTKSWTLSRGGVAQGNTILSNHDGALDDHSIINSDNTLLLVREAGYRTGVGALNDEYAQLTLEEVDVIKETDRLPQRHRQVTSRDRMKWLRDKAADHYEEWASQIAGYDNYHDDMATGTGGMSRTASQEGWWDTSGDVLHLKSDNEEGVAFATWSSRIMNGQVKSEIRVETASNGEYAGVIFRGRDRSNFWAAYYNETDDTIKLRQKLGGTWQTVAATTGALGWSIDTWYGIMVDFRYSYVRVFYSTDGDSWTQAFTYTIPANAPNVPLEYGYTGLVGYGYSDQDTDDAAGFEDDDPPPDLGTGNLIYFTDGTSGRVFRSRNVRHPNPGAVVYEDLGVVDANGVNYIALDSWDPKNRAMIVTANGAGGIGGDYIYRTTNLDSDAPTWTRVLDLSGSNDTVSMVASSICTQDLWMCCGDQNTAQKSIWVRVSTDGGDSWARYDLTSTGTSASSDVRIELSSHDANKAWIAWLWDSGTPNSRCTYTSNQWVGRTEVLFAVATAHVNPYHRYSDNSTDQNAVWIYTQAPSNSVAHVCTADVATCTDNTISGAQIPLWQGGYTWGTNRYWLLANDGTDDAFWVSNDAATWTKQYTFPTGENIQYVSGWPYVAERFYSTLDGTSAPIKISNNRGVSWQDQTGNWAVLGYTGDITCCVPVFTE